MPFVFCFKPFDVIFIKMLWNKRTYKSANANDAILSHIKSKEYPSDLR